MIVFLRLSEKIRGMVEFRYFQFKNSKYNQMGNYLHSFLVKESKVKLLYLNTNQLMDFSSKLTVKQLKNILYNVTKSPIQLFYNWAPIDPKYQNQTLQTIIKDQNKAFHRNTIDSRLFLMIEQSKIYEKQKQKHQKLLQKLENIEITNDEELMNFETGHNGKVVFQGREAALLASGVSLGLQNCNAAPQKLQTFLSNDLNLQNYKPSLIKSLLTKIGIHKKKITSQEIYQIIENLKSSKQYSDFDPKFVYFILEIYFKFMVLNLGKIHYIDYKNIDDFQIESICSKSKIGIIGDFGTGLKDSIELLNNMILKHDVDVIFHLGDVYYAGTPSQYQKSIVKPLQQLRLKTKKQIRFYSIPGNHDYYSWGLPFLCFVKGINKEEFQKQKASYFCIRDQLNKWQFLGMDTAYFDSSPLSQIDSNGVGPHVQNKQLLWHRHRLQNFPGSTVLMTHHQLFSIHERINGKISKYRKFSCINPMLYGQMFQHMSSISAWFWGHEHSIMMFKQKVFNLFKGRLLGNSSFHVMYQKQNPYARQKNYPYIPFITSDSEYLKKYLPVNPNTPTNDYFALSYAVIDMSKMDQEDNLPIEYWCSPSYSDDQFKKMDEMTNQMKRKVYFQQYKMFEEKILSIGSIRKARRTIACDEIVFVRCEIGLALSSHKQLLVQRQIMLGNDAKKIEQPHEIERKQINSQNTKQTSIQSQNSQLYLNLQGSAFMIKILDEKSSGNRHLWEFTLKSVAEKNKSPYFLGVTHGKLQLIQILQSSQLTVHNAIWLCENMDHEKNSLKEQNNSIYYGQPLKIQNKNLKKFLSWEIISNDAYPKLQNIQYELKKQQLQIQRVNEQNLESLWIFEKENLLKENAITNRMNDLNCFAKLQSIPKDFKKNERIEINLT